MKLIKSKLMRTRKDSIERVFIEDKKLLKTNFEIGQKYTYNINFETKVVTIKANNDLVSCNDKKVKVSSKQNKDDSSFIPVVDIRHPNIRKVFKGVRECLVEVFEDKIIICPNTDYNNNVLSTGKSSKILDFFKLNKRKKEIRYVVDKNNLDICLKKASGSDTLMNQISMFDLGFSLSTDYETQDCYNTIKKSDYLQKELNDVVVTSTLLKDFTYLELFAGSGIGGLALDKHGAINVGYSEVDKHAIKNYDFNFPGRINWGDVTQIDISKLPFFDILIGGSPCQDISIMKKVWLENKQVEGLNGSESSLFFNYVDVLNKKKPKWFIFENVQNLLNSNSGEDFKVVRELFEANYNIKWEVLNTADYGIPQTRRRLYIVGQRKDLGDFNFNFPNKIPLNMTMQDLLEKEVADKYFLTEKMKEYVLKEGTGNFKQKPETDLKIARPLTQSMHKCHRAGTDNYITVPDKYPVGKSNLRKLLPIECSRLQGILDDSYKFVVSDTQAYRLMGNAMSLNVVSLIAKKLGMFIKRQFGIGYSFA